MKKELVIFYIALRNLKFEIGKSLGIFWLTEKVSFLKIKEPYNKLYQRDKKKNKSLHY